VLGHSIGPLAAELAPKHLEKVYAVEHALLQDYTPDAYTIALRQLLELAQPSIVLFPQTYQVRDFLPKLAASLGKVAVSDAISHRVEDGQLVLVRQLFQGKVNVDSRFAAMRRTSLLCRRRIPPGPTCRPRTRGRRAPLFGGGEVCASHFPRRHPHQAARAFLESQHLVDLGAAEIIVSVGRGIKKPATFR